MYVWNIVISPGAIVIEQRLMSCVFFVLLLVSFFPLQSQDYRNDMFSVRRAGHEPRTLKRTEITQTNELLRPFYHGVASGDPLQDKVVIWTRVTPENGDSDVDVAWAIATDTLFRNVVQNGRVRTGSNRDFTVKIDVQELQSGTVYYYVFTAYGRSSLIGRTRTLAESTDHVRIAVVSCSNYPAGYFNAYAQIAKRNDLDAVVHLGDYIYEYDADTTSYGGATGAALGRRNMPDAELVSLTDYRTRYSQYRLDQDLQALHQQHPVIHVWDDHESANDAYTDGAENHQTATEGDWNVRKSVSKRVCYEWMPTRENTDTTIYRGFSFGNLMELAMLDTRLDGRNRQVQGVGKGASQASRDSMNAADRTMISKRQYDWLAGRLTQTTAQWKVLGNQVLFAPVTVDPIDTTFLFEAIGPIFSAFLKPQLPQLQNIFDLAFTGDVWSNYPAQRNNLLNLIRSESVKNVVVLTGDFHTAFAFEVPDAASPLAVEFATPSITSANFDENLSSIALLRPILLPLLQTVDTTLRGLNPHLKWQNLVRHGYQVLDVLNERVQCDWYFVDTLLMRPSAERWAWGGITTTGTSRITPSSSQAPGKSKQDVPAPAAPPQTPLSVSDYQKASEHTTVLSYGPNPATDAFSITYLVHQPAKVTVAIYNSEGKMVRSTPTDTESGLRSAVFSLVGLPQGAYTVVLEIQGVVHSTGIVIRR